RVLREEVRDFLRAELGDRAPARRAHSWGGFDREFSRKVGARGWIGMTWPKRYGGHERSSLERYVVLEETLAAGAPVSAHWVADRQSGPRSEEHTSELQSRGHLVCRVLLDKKEEGQGTGSVAKTRPHM